MKNPHLTLKLNRMMADELNEKKELITCIIDYYRKKQPKMNVFSEICNLMELSVTELSEILSEIIDQPVNKMMLNINLN